MNILENQRFTLKNNIKGLAILGAFLTLFLMSANLNQTKAQETQALNWHTAQEAMDKNIVSAPQNILTASFYYDPISTTKVSITNVKAQIGQFPASYTQNPEYYVILKDSKGAKLYSSVLVIPRNIKDTSIDQAIEFSINMPYRSGASMVQIVDIKGNIISSYEIGILDIQNITPSFSTVRGDEVQNNILITQNQSSKINNANTDGYLDIVYIGDNYTASQLSEYQAQANAITQRIVSVDPFKIRASQIRFHRIDTNTDLGCRTDNNNQLACSLTRVNQAVTNAGVPYDKILILIKGYPVGSNAFMDWIYAYIDATNASLDIPATHELGHTLGLLDEYTYERGGGTYIANKNCYKGTLPNPAWSGLVGAEDYALGCSDATWYRPSPTSLMESVSTPIYFNDVSRNVLNSTIDSLAVPFTPTTAAPTVSITCPTNNYIDRGTILLCLTYTNKSSINSMQLWIDGRFIKTMYDPNQIANYIALNRPELADGMHNIQYRVFDGIGRMGSANVNIDLRNTVPFGFIENITDGNVKGWAIDSNNTAASIGLEFYQDGPKGQGVYMGSAIANINRTDLEEPGNHGFLWSIPSQFRDGRQHTVWAYAIDTSGNINDNRHLYNLSNTYQLVSRTWNFKLASTCGFESTKVAYTVFTNDQSQSWQQDLYAQGIHTVSTSTQSLNAKAYLALLSTNGNFMLPETVSNSAMKIVQRPIYNFPGVPNGTYKYVVEVDSNTLASGNYNIDLQAVITCTRTWTIKVQSTCASTPVSSSFAVWPPNPLVWTTDSYAAGVHTLNITSNNPTSSIYVMLSDNSTDLVPTGTRAHPNMVYGTYFNPLTPMAKWNSAEVPAGTYTITYQDTNTSCTTVRGGSGIQPDPVTPISTSYVMDRKRYS